MAPRAKARAVFLSALALLCFCGCVAYVSISDFRGSESWVNHTQGVRAAFGDLEATINDAARMRTSYLISGDDSDLTGYRTAALEVRERMRQLRELTKGNPSQVDRCARLESVVNARLQAWEDSIAQRKEGKPVDLSRLLRQSVNFASQNAAAAEEIRVEEARLLGQQTRAAQQRFVLASLIVISSFLLALFLLYLHYRLLSIELRAREKAEQAAREAYTREVTLRQEGERFRLFVEAVKDHAIFMLDAEGHVITWNKGAERLKGYTAWEILGEHFSRFFPEEAVQRGEPERELGIATREGRIEDEGWRVRKDGSRFWANVIITAVQDDRGQLIGFAKITRDFTERMRAQEALRRANAELAAEVAERKSAEQKLASSEKSLRDLSRHLLRTQDEERRRIGRDLHDSLGQYLAVLKMNLDSLESVLGSSHDGAAQQVAQCARLAEDSLKEVRTISYLLYPPMLEEMGLKSAIAWYLDGFSKRSNVQTTLEVDLAFGRLAREAELALFRVLQESLTNVHRHSGSSTASIRLSMADGKAVLEIKDTGRGIPSKLLEQSGEDGMGFLGVGLRGMNERMRQLGGKLEISSTENGTVVTANVPAGEPFSAMTKSA